VPPTISEFAESAYQLAWDLMPEEVPDTFTAAHHGKG
jgi:hypothetical protein